MNFSICKERGEIMRGWLKKMRLEKGYTMKEMGQKLGISESYYCAIENGERQKRLDMMLASEFATVFGIQVSEIVRLEQELQAKR